MTEQFLTYEQALAVKELGFDEPCFGYYNNKKELTFNTNVNLVIKDWVWDGNEILPIDMVLAPLKSQFFNWVREKYGYHVQIRRLYFGVFTSDSEVEYNYFIYPKYSNEHLEHNLLDEYTAYEYAENACINDIINLIKGKL